MYSLVHISFLLLQDDLVIINSDVVIILVNDAAVMPSLDGPLKFLPRLNSAAPSEKEFKETAMRLLLDKDNVAAKQLEPDYLDPATEISVKLADLGNACWTVCLFLLTFVKVMQLECIVDKSCL